MYLLIGHMSNYFLINVTFATLYSNNQIMPNSRTTQSIYKLLFENASEPTSQTSINYMSTRINVV